MQPSADRVGSEQLCYCGDISVFCGEFKICALVRLDCTLVFPASQSCLPCLLDNGYEVDLSVYVGFSASCGHTCYDICSGGESFSLRSDVDAAIDQAFLSLPVFSYTVCYFIH